MHTNGMPAMVIFDFKSMYQPTQKGKQDIFLQTSHNQRSMTAYPTTEIPNCFPIVCFENKNHKANIHKAPYYAVLL